MRYSASSESVNDFPNLKAEVADGVAHVVIDKPPANTLDYGLYDELSRLLDVLESDTSVRAVLFSSANEKIFISGADINDMVDYDRRRGASARKVDTVHATFQRLQRFSKPTVAAITVSHAPPPWLTGPAPGTPRPGLEPASRTRGVAAGTDPRHRVRSDNRGMLAHDRRARGSPTRPSAPRRGSRGRGGSAPR